MYVCMYDVSSREFSSLSLSLPVHWFAVVQVVEVTYEPLLRYPILQLGITFSISSSIEGLALVLVSVFGCIIVLVLLLIRVRQFKQDEERERKKERKEESNKSEGID